MPIDAARIVLERGLIKVIGLEQYKYLADIIVNDGGSGSYNFLDKYRVTYGLGSLASIPDGFAATFYNLSDYSSIFPKGTHPGPWPKENVITTTRFFWWGFGGGLGGVSNPTDYRGWLTELLFGYNAALKSVGRPVLTPQQINQMVDDAVTRHIPKGFGWDGKATFWNLAKIGQTLFQQNSKQQMKAGSGS